MNQTEASAGTRRGAGIFTRFGLLILTLVCLGCSAPRAICAASASQQVLGRSRIARLPAVGRDTHPQEHSALSVLQKRVERANSRGEVEQHEEEEEQDRGRKKANGEGREVGSSGSSGMHERDDVGVPTTMREQQLQQQQLEQQHLQQQQQQQQLQQHQQQQERQRQLQQQLHQLQQQQPQPKQQQQQPQQQQQQWLQRKNRLDEVGKEEQQSERWKLARALITIKRSSSTARPRIRTPYPGIKAHVVVDKSGRGNYTTIQKALNDAPAGQEGAPYVIYVRAGTYAEGVSVDKEWIAVVGDGPTKTIVRRAQSAANGYNTYFSAVFGVNQDGFAAIGMRFVNDARDSPGVALRITGDMALVLNCDVIGFQDTLYAHSGRQYYRYTRVQGTVDFICGRAAAVFDRCTATLTQRERENLHTTVMASGSDTRDDSLGFVFVNGALRGNTGSGSNYGFLGRPWKRYSRMVYINTYMSSVLRPDGWSSWDGELWAGRPYYAEYGSRGPGGRSGGRVSFAKPGRISKSEAAKFLPGPFLGIESWKKYTIVPWLRYTTTI